MAAELRPYIATYDAPGFHEVERVWAADENAALITAQDNAAMPRKGWPRRTIHAGRMTITIRPAVVGKIGD